MYGVCKQGLKSTQGRSINDPKIINRVQTRIFADSPASAIRLSMHACKSDAGLTIYRYDREKSFAFRLLDGHRFFP
jgi:hypothetical protein